MNPCPTCTRPDPCTTCLPRLAWEGAQPHPQQRECLTCVDINWLTAAGETQDNIATRLGLTRTSLQSHQHRHRT